MKGQKIFIISKTNQSMSSNYHELFLFKKDESFWESVKYHFKKESVVENDTEFKMPQDLITKFENTFQSVIPIMDYITIPVYELCFVSKDKFQDDEYRKGYELLNNYASNNANKIEIIFDTHLFNKLNKAIKKGKYL